MAATNELSSILKFIGNWLAEKSNKVVFERIERTAAPTQSSYASGAVIQWSVDLRHSGTATADGWRLLGIESVQVQGTNWSKVNNLQWVISGSNLSVQGVTSAALTGTGVPRIRVIASYYKATPDT